MSQIIVLDASPLSLLASPRKTGEVLAISRWAREQLAAGRRLVVPAIADYEVRRELVRLRRTQSVARLDAFNTAAAGRYVPLSDAALRLGAELWAQARNAGTPTGDPRELDCDVLIAAQALTLGVPVGVLVVATVNVGHLAQFVPAELWTNIKVA
jgi:predicted nucleic acid-binding protein